MGRRKISGLIGATLIAACAGAGSGATAGRRDNYLRQVAFRIVNESVLLHWKDHEMPLQVYLPRPPEGMFEDPEAIFAFGNAPTALFRLLELIDEGVARPKLVIGVVVGFVGAAESKDALMQRKDVSWISCKGNKGGSNVAAASVNALFKGAAGEV